jgi:glycosyltransferase involved in cell wall biosynthesis
MTVQLGWIAMAAPVSPGASARIVRRELRVVEEQDRTPRDACLVLLDRSGSADFASAAKGAAEGTDLSLRVLSVSAADRMDPRYAAGDMRFGAGAWWSTVVRDVVEEVDEELIVFLEISSLVVFNGAVALASELQASDAAAIGARVLDPRGITIAFDRGRFDVLTHRESEHRGFVASSVPMTHRPSLFFDGRAFAARRSALAAVGAPSPQLEDELGDVDWGWRLWVAGHRVLTSAATSVLEHEPGALPPRPKLPGPMRHAREHHAALRVLGEVLEPDNLARAFALSTSVGAASTGSSSDALVGHDPGAVVRPNREATLDGLAIPAALHEVGADEELAAERAEIQRCRVLSDEQIFAEVGTIFGSSPTATPEGSAIRNLLVPRAQRTRPVVLILCSDDLGASMAGPAIRSVELARALMQQADPVIVAHRVDPDADPPCPAATVSEDLLRTLLADVDAVVIQGPVTDWYPMVLRSGIPIAVDLYDPMHLEALQRADADAELPYVLNLVIEQLRRGDFFFCASERQRDYWLGMLSSLGRVTPEAYAEDPDLRSLIDVVPYGISAEAPVRVGQGPRETVEGIGSDDVLLVWNGGLWDWFDTATFLRALAQVRHELPMLRAYFMGVLRPGSTELAPAARKVMALSDELGLTGKVVFFNDWTPFGRRQDVYLDATAIVSLHHAHLESRFSFRTRLLDALWGRVPILCTSGDVVAGIVEELQLGITVPPGDVDAVAQAFRDIVADPALFERARARLESAAPAYEWQHAVKPLARWLAQPQRRSDLVIVAGLRAVDAQQARREDFERYANELKMLVPTPVRRHVLGPLKRGLKSAGRAAWPR